VKRPPHQLILTATLYAGVIFLGFGSLLDAMINAQQIVSPAVTLLCTLLLILVWIGIGIWVRLRPITWVLRRSQRVRINRLGLKIHSGFAGALALLWIPRLLTSTPTRKEDSFRQGNIPPFDSTANSSGPTLNSDMRLRIGGFELTIRNDGRSPATGIAVDVFAWQEGSPGAEVIQSYPVRDLGPNADFTIYGFLENQTGPFERPSHLEISGYFAVSCVTCSRTRAWAFHAPPQATWYADLAAHEDESGSWILREFVYPEKKPPIASCVDVPVGICRRRGYLWKP